MTDQIAQNFLDRSQHFLTIEYPTKMRAAVESLPASALWWRANDQSNSVGNLLLHLAGNVRQWIIVGVGGAQDSRNRAAEFAAREGPPANELLDALENTLREAGLVIARVKPEQLLEHRTIQARPVTVLDAIYHVVEHFSMHMGQVILVAKMHAPDAIRFYEDAGGLAKPLWTKLPPPI